MTLTPAMIELLAAAAYNTQRPPGNPIWEDHRLNDAYKNAIRREVTAAIQAGVAAGFLTVGADNG